MDLDLALRAAPVIAIVRLPSAEGLDDAVAAVVDGGVRAVEVTLTTPGALDAVARARRRHGDGVAVGVGSVRDPTDVDRATGAGATFLVTPTTRPDVLDRAILHGVPVVAGGLTATELDTARLHGATYQKLFPASAVSPAYVRDLLAPMPDLRLVPTGGVSLDNAAAWRAAGAAAVAVGSSVVRSDRTPEEIRSAAARLLQAWHTATPDRTGGKAAAGSGPDQRVRP